ncbi:MAG: DUF4430 domain-containing protein [Defluviitaleaceae bacterium]|nr:DUF4430 domain-containing protein [Defluviitaleaceae bacterium]
MKKIFPLLVLCVIFFASCGAADNSDAYRPYTVALHVRVDMLVANMHALDSSQHELIPADGVIFSGYVAVAVGETVFDVLQRTMRDERIHMSARFTPIINEAYVEAIGNIFAFDAGALSGWKFHVNGEFPGISASSVELRDGDVVIWAYTLDLGRDLGATTW